MKRTYAFETKLTVTVAVEFDYWPGYPATREDPEEPSDIGVKEVYIRCVNAVDGSSLTDSLDEALDRDPELMDELIYECASFAETKEAYRNQIGVE